MAEKNCRKKQKPDVVETKKAIDTSKPNPFRLRAIPVSSLYTKTGEVNPFLQVKPKPENKPSEFIETESNKEG